MGPSRPTGARAPARTNAVPAPVRATRRVASRSQHPLRARERCDQRAVPQHARGARERQHRAGFEIHEQQTGARAHREIAQRVEEKVAAEIGPERTLAAPLALDAHKPAFPPRCETSQPWRASPPRAFAADVAMKKVSARRTRRAASGERPRPSVRGPPGSPCATPSRAVRAAPSVVVPAAMLAAAPLESATNVGVRA